MRTGRPVLMIAILAAAGCSREGDAPTAYGARETYGYLQKVGRIRSMINADNRDRIPAMIRGRDSEMLGRQGARLEEYKRSLAALESPGVDPEALKFTQSLEAIIDSYRAVCLDSAELSREMKESGARPSAPAVAVPVISLGTEAYQGDTIGTLNSLLDSMERIDAAPKSASVFLQPIVNKVRDDRERLRSAKAAHHAFTTKLKGELKLRYPDKDWTSKEILP